VRYLVNGVEAELDAAGATVHEDGDRLWIMTASRRASALAVRRGDKVFVSLEGRTFEVERPTAALKAHSGSASGDSRAPMPGQVVEIFVEQGQQVQAGEKLLILEAMKMQHAVTAPFAGTVGPLPVRKGDQVGEGQLLAHVEARDESSV